jgi:hypothetical protein
MSNNSNIKTSNEPKKNKSSYMFFCTDERIIIKNDQSISLNNKEILTELGLRWKKLKEEDSDKVKYYEKLAKDDKIRYESEKSSSVLVAEKQVLVEEDNKIEQDTKKQKKIVINRYINFCKKNRDVLKQKNKELSPKDITKKLAEEWKLLNEDEKQKYKY